MDESREAVTLLVEAVRAIMYGYKAPTAQVRRELKPLVERVEKSYPLYRRGLDGKFIETES